MKMLQPSSLEEQLRKSVSAKVIPSPKGFETIEVEVLTDESLIDKFAKIEYAALEIAFAHSRTGLPFTEEEFTDYCKSIVKDRVAWVRNDRQAMHFRPEFRIAVPALLYVVTSNIGNAYDVVRGITLKPTTSYQHVLTKDRREEISMFLQSIPSYEGALGYLKDKNGTWDFMSMQTINAFIWNENAQAHPVYSFIAAVVGPKQLQSSLQTYVKYGNIDLLSELLWEFTSL